MVKGRLIIVLAMGMCLVLVGIQIARIYPVGMEIPEDPLMGEPLKAFQSLVEQGQVVLDVLGPYTRYKAMIYKNGDRYLLVEEFPVTVKVMEGDVLEIWVLEEIPGTSLIVKNFSENISMKYVRTGLPLEKGLHRIGRIIQRSY